MFGKRSSHAGENRMARLLPLGVLLLELDHTLIRKPLPSDHTTTFNKHEDHHYRNNRGPTKQ